MQNRAEYKRDLRTYVIGLCLALTLTAVPFSLVAWRWLPPIWILIVTFTLGFIQVVVHFRQFLHINLSRSSRDDLYVLLFSTLIVLLMVSGTLVIMFNLHHRMM